LEAGYSGRVLQTAYGFLANFIDSAVFRSLT
jgi:hypothetical protein